MLLFESIAADEVFQPGETWDFIVMRMAVSPSPFDSLGVPSTGPSRASIVGTVVPEPGTGLLLTLGLGGLARFGRRRSAERR